jgi:hypothetical protein
LAFGEEMTAMHQHWCNNPMIGVFYWKCAKVFLMFIGPRDHETALARNTSQF